MNNPLDTQLTLRTDAGDEAQLRNLPAPVMQALYHQLTGKTEKLTASYDGHYLIRAADIRNLIEKIAQTLQQFNYKATSTNLTVFHHQREKITFSSLSKFLEYDTTKSDPTSAINIEIGLLISVPMVETHQNYRISIEIASFVLLDGDKRPAMGIGHSYRERSCVQFSIDYVDYVVARSFTATMDEWERSLDRTKLFTLPEWFDENEWQLRRGFTAIGTSAAIWGAASIAGEGGNDVMRGSLVAICAILAYFFFGLIIEKAQSYLSVHRYFPYILFNKGDERNYNKFIERRALANKIGFAIFTSGVLVIIANVFARYISRKLGLI